MSAPSGLNAWLDRLPRTRFGLMSSAVPAFRSCGIAGFYLAVLAVIAGALLRGQSLMVHAVLSCVCGLSFYAWAYARRAITSREDLVLLEHVWFALLAASTTLWLLGVPVLAHLDVVATGMAFFLAAGRVGCLLVGCCHGQPCGVGIRYGAGHAQDGFPRHWVGVRLFPVPALESMGLCVIGATALLALRFAAAGSVLCWFLASYSVMRFGLEGLRGDRRPHALGLSVNRWMALAEFSFAAATTAGVSHDSSPAVAAAFAGSVLVLVVALVASARRSSALARALLRREHLASMARLVREASATATEEPAVRCSPAGVSVAVSSAPSGGRLVSLRLPEGAHDLRLLGALAAGALPGAIPDESRLSQDGRVALFRVPAPAEAPGAVEAPSEALIEVFYASLARQLQDISVAADAPSRDFAAPPPASRERDPLPVAAPTTGGERPSWNGVPSTGEALPLRLFLGAEARRME